MFVGCVGENMMLVEDLHHAAARATEPPHESAYGGAQRPNPFKLH